MAFELFKKIGLIYEQENGILKIPYISDIVGSETDSAERVRKHRALQCNKNVTDSTLHCNIDIDKDIDLEKEKDKDKDISLSDKSNGVLSSS
ncbi:MAG: phage replisome organizer N-terminal domain-containing protein [Ruminococcus sp.]|nr:phage replisome organizer N-terminal domain-containing protein [Ruminococcus sp.]